MNFMINQWMEWGKKKGYRLFGQMRGVPNIQIFADVQFDDSNGDDV